MPYVGENWPQTDPTIMRPYTYDFTQRIPEDDTITSVTWQLATAPTLVFNGVDPNPQAHVSAPANNRATATAWLDSLVANTRYKLTVFIETQSGIKDDLWSYLTCLKRPGG